jgi:diacylglycerol kinase family enzyme
VSYSVIAIIYNPNSTGSSSELARQLEAQLRAKQPRQKIELIATEYAGHAEELAYSIAMSGTNPLIISSSGDGGYHEVINGALKAQLEGATPTTGLLPAGNANDHHRNLHGDDLIDLIVKKKTRRIDVLKMTAMVNGKLTDRYAHSYIGFGLTPIIGAELNKTNLNIWKETWLVVRSLVALKPVKLKIGDKPKRYESVIFSNIDSMAKYLQVSRPSSITDGKFEVTIFRQRRKVRLLLTLLKASFGKVKENTQVSEFFLSTVHETLVQADGEILKLDANSEVRITSEKQLLASIV